MFRRYLFARLIERPTYALACGYALAAGVTFYFHYFGLLVPLAHAVSLVALPKERRPWKQLFVAGAMVTMLAVPVLWMIHTQPIRHLDWVSKPSLLEVYHLGVFLAAESGKGVGPALLVMELVLVVVFFRAMMRARKNPELQPPISNSGLDAGLKASSITQPSKGDLDAGPKAGSTTDSLASMVSPRRDKAQADRCFWSYALVASGLLTPMSSRCWCRW